MSLIDRAKAIDALKAAYWDKNIQSAKDDPCVVDAMTDWAIRQVKALPSAQPYTEAEIQKMQDLEQAEVEKAFELGREDGKTEIIHCRDCKYTDGCEPIEDGRYWCCLHESFMYYCSDAERKE